MSRWAKYRQAGACTGSDGAPAKASWYPHCVDVDVRTRSLPEEVHGGPGVRVHRCPHAPRGHSMRRGLRSGVGNFDGSSTIKVLVFGDSWGEEGPSWHELVDVFAPRGLEGLKS